MKNKQQEMKMYYLRTIKGIRRGDKIKNELVREEVMVESMLQCMEKSQLF